MTAPALFRLPAVSASIARRVSTGANAAHAAAACAISSRAIVASQQQRSIASSASRSFPGPTQGDRGECERGVRAFPLCILAH